MGLDLACRIFYEHFRHRVSHTDSRFASIPADDRRCGFKFRGSYLSDGLETHAKANTAVEISIRCWFERAAAERIQSNVCEILFIE